MPKTASDVRVGVDGVIAAGAYGSPAPTTALSTLDVAFTDLGYVTDDGVTESTDLNNKDLRAWQQNALIRNVVGSATTTWKMTLMQSSAAVLGYYYNATVAADGSFVVNPGLARPIFAAVLDVIDGSSVIRKYAPSAQITDIGDLKYVNDDSLGYDVTITANYDTGISGAFKVWGSPLATAVVPTISSVLPAAATTGSLVTITGTGFALVTATATNVKFGATSATNFTVVSDSKIIATMPAGSAGAANVTVVNPTGTSTAFVYTRGA